MLEKIDSAQIPSRFAFCYKSDCRRAGECLRYQAAEYVSGERPAVCAVNPLSISTDGGCRQFKACQVVKYAYGMTEAWGSLPCRTVKEVRHCLLGYFGKTHFYRLMRKQRCFSPEDQAYVESVFRQFGITGELVFDSYRVDYEW